MQPVPANPSAADSSAGIQLALQHVVQQLSPRAAADPRQLVQGAELTDVVSTLSTATLIFHDHAVIRNASVVASNAQPVADLLLAAQLLLAALLEDRSPR